MNRRGRPLTKARVLIVCMWPLGGISTYLKYNYRYFPGDRFEITLLANPAVESGTLEKEMRALGIKVVWARPLLGKNILFLWIAFMLLKKRFDLIHSQGFISAFHVSLVNRPFRKPHVLTIHGVLEEKRFRGWTGRLKRSVFEMAMRDVDVFVGVGKDILDHVKRALPRRQDAKTQWIVIRNGINPQPFLEESPNAREELRQSLRIDPATFVFGYFGRFMPEKGFGYIIESVKIIRDKQAAAGQFVVMAVGSGDYESEYKGQVKQAGMTEVFRFLPFQPTVVELMKGCDAVVAPSVWEAYPLLTSEVLCCGVPIIASDCLGLREATADTPAVQVPAADASALADAMTEAMADPHLKEAFLQFRSEAARRYDVKDSAQKLIALFDDLLQSRAG